MGQAESAQMNGDRVGGTAAAPPIPTQVGSSNGYTLTDQQQQQAYQQQFHQRQLQAAMQQQYLQQHQQQQQQSEAMKSMPRSAPLNNNNGIPYQINNMNLMMPNANSKNSMENAAIAAWQQQQLQYIRTLPPQQQMQYYQQYQHYIQQQYAEQQQYALKAAAESQQHPQYYHAKEAAPPPQNLNYMMQQMTVTKQQPQPQPTPSDYRPQAEQYAANEWNKAWDNDEGDDSSAEERKKQSPKKRASIVPADATTPNAVETKEEEHVLSKQADLVLQTGDGVKWDTEAGAGGAVYEKPNIEMFFPLLRVLGKGSFGKVVLVRKRTGQESGGLFAMKILRKAHLVKRRQIERTKTERKVLSVVDHPFIMKLHFAFQSDDKLYLVLDYCPGGELFFHLSRYRRFPERVARFYAAELLLAIGHLHRRGIIYRDLKPENVLLDAEGHVKLGDFGLAKDKITDPCSGATSMCGTPEYMAPEVLSQAGHGFCVDYWGLGMLIYEMMTGLPPWYTTDRQKLFKRLKSAPLEIPSYFSPASASVSTHLLDRNPRNRLGVTGIRLCMEHDFFKPIQWKALLSKRIDAPIRPCEGWKVPDNISNGSSMPHAPSSQNSQQSKYSPHNVNLDPRKAHLDTDTLNAATANFDQAFTRMPVETEDHPGGGQNDDALSLEGSEELNEKTFTGFTFDHAVEPKPSKRTHKSAGQKIKR